MLYITRLRSTPPSNLFQTLGVAAVLGLGALATGCGGGGGSSAAVVPVQASPGFDLAKDVHPFDPALVKQWPGLPNVGTSCYVNAGIKLLAAMPELDPFLVAEPADDAATAEVRTSLRRIINFIRSGGVLVGAPERDAMGLLQAVFQAFANHRDLRSSMVNIRGGGGFVTTVVNSSLKVLNVRNQFTMRVEVKNTPLDHPQPPSYMTDHSNVLIVSTDPLNGAFDFTQVHNSADFIRLAFTEPCTFPSGQAAYTHHRVRTFPTLVPNHMVMEFNHQLGPTRALPFSEQVVVPTYAVDRARMTETRQGDVPMRALAAAVYRPGHFWAVIRGEDGWYENNDATPTRRVEMTDLDEQADPQGALTRNLELVLYQRSDS